MMPRTFLEPPDDPAFLAIVDRIVAALVRRDAPADATLVHVDNWFDHKWLGYSGKGIVAFDYGSMDIVVALDPHRQDQVTFPPFAPNRVVAEYLYCRAADGAYDEQPPTHLVHHRRRQRSSRNLQRRVADATRSGFFVWYSSGSAANRRGSVMVYTSTDDIVDTWYAGFEDDRGWRLNQVKGIARDAVLSLMEAEP